MTIKFSQLGLPEQLVRALAERDFVDTFPIQAATIPDALAGKDVSGMAPTGSGKTIAFGLPLLTNIDKAGRLRPRGLVLAPTRELAEQIKQDLAPLAKAVNKYIFSVYGGVGYGPQKQALRRGVDVLVATPGRLEDLIEQRSVDLGMVQFVVVDEADRMADMGFLPAVRRLLDQTPIKRQTMLFSATLDGDIAVLSRDYQNNPVRHDAEAIEPDTADASHHFWLVEHHDRVQHAADVITRTGSSIVFTRTRHGADRLAKQLDRLGVRTVAMHGGRSQSQRTRALKDFSTGRAQALIATDVAARGIHVDSVASVIHYDIPADHKDYLHRSGRTGRAGATGTVVSLVTGQQKGASRRLQRDLGFEGSLDEPSVTNLDEDGQRMGEPRADRPQRSTRRPERPARTASKPELRRHDQGQNIYVSNLSWATTSEDLRAMFSKFGDVHEAVVMTDRESGRSRGFGFVGMSDASAKKAISEMDGSSIDGRDIKVTPARPRPSSKDGNRSFDRKKSAKRGAYSKRSFR